jgi:hypothetical protein
MEEKREEREERRKRGRVGAEESKRAGAGWLLGLAKVDR